MQAYIKRIVTVDVANAFKATPEADRYKYCIKLLKAYYALDTDMNKASKSWRLEYIKADAEDFLNYLSFTMPQLGQGVTTHGYSDSHAGTVIAVSKSGKQITIQMDTATLAPHFKPEFIVGGFAGHCINQQDQEWIYERNTKGAIRKASIRWNKKGGYRWILVGESARNGTSVTAGRHKFYDYNF